MGFRRLPAGLATLLVSGLVLLDACSGSTAASTKAKGHGHPAAPTAGFSVMPAAGDRGANPAAPVVVHASQGVLASARVVDSAGTPLHGTLSADRTTWTSRERMAYDQRYVVTATARAKGNRQVTTTSSFTTTRPHGLISTTVFPNADLSSVGVGQPVSVTFDQPVADRAAAQRSMSVRSTPAVDGTWHWVSDTEVRWRPKEFWPAGTKVDVDVDLLGRDLGKGMYGKDSSHVSFQVHDSWIAVGDTSTHRLVIYHDGKQVEDFPASFGGEYPTHDGVHVVQEKYDLFYMSSASWGLPASAPGGYSNFPAYWATRISNDGEFVHANDGTTYAQGSANVTHGCINLTTERAKWFYDHFGYGDVVRIVGGSPLLPVDDGYGDWNESYAAYLKGSAVN